MAIIWSYHPYIISFKIKYNWICRINLFSKKECSCMRFTSWFSLKFWFMVSCSYIIKTRSAHCEVHVYIAHVQCHSWRRNFTNLRLLEDFDKEAFHADPTGILWFPTGYMLDTKQCDCARRCCSWNFVDFSWIFIYLYKFVKATEISAHFHPFFTYVG